MPQIYDMGPTALLPLRRKACWGFFRPKNPTASADFEPANLGTKGQHATPRPPKPLNIIILELNLRGGGIGKVIHLEHNFVWCWKLDTLGSRSEISGMFWHVVLEKHGKVQLDGWCDKEGVLQRVKVERNILQTVKMRDATWIGHILRKNCLSKRPY